MGGAAFAKFWLKQAEACLLHGDFRLEQDLLSGTRSRNMPSRYKEITCSCFCQGAGPRNCPRHLLCSKEQHDPMPDLNPPKSKSSLRQCLDGVRKELHSNGPQNRDFAWTQYEALCPQLLKGETFLLQYRISSNSSNAKNNMRGRH